MGNVAVLVAITAIAWLVLRRRRKRRDAIKRSRQDAPVAMRLELAGQSKPAELGGAPKVTELENPTTQWEMP